MWDMRVVKPVDWEEMLFLRDYDIVRIKAYLKGKGVFVRDA